MQIVEETLRKFADDLSLILKGNLFEIIIHGSYVLGDFQANHGDIDFLGLTHDNFDEETVANLIGLHKGYRKSRQLLLHQLEGTYYPKYFLCNPEEALSGLYIGTTGMKPIYSRKNSYMDLRLINRKGLMLLGNQAETFDPSEADLIEEQKADSQGFRDTIDKATSIDLGFWISMIHWCARTFFYRAKGEIGSKTEACQWCARQPALEDFNQLFNMAESLRYPYPRREILKTTKTKCIKLLDMLDA
ncbi:MAG: hypothetical protein GF388_10565 [Candidatus Aegiribacteria sp.]|nr:hypothetical protein [Candidatus Aegiribacteria sp.]